MGDLTTRRRARGKKIVLFIDWLDSKHPEWNTVRLGQPVSPDWADRASAHHTGAGIWGGSEMRTKTDGDYARKAVRSARDEGPCTSESTG